MNKSSKPEHLNDEAFAQLALSDAERIRAIKTPIWIDYPRAEKIQEWLLDCFDYPANSRMPSGLVCGESNSGKSRLVEWFVEKQNAAMGTESSLPILCVQAPPAPNPRELYVLCLREMKTIYHVKDSPMELRFQLEGMVEQLGTRMIVVDEVHHLVAGATGKQIEFLHSLKYISNKVKIPLVGIGTRAALDAFHFDDQTASRFEPWTLPRWKDGDDFRRLLASFELATPLRERSDLFEDALAAKLLLMSEGLLGELVTLIRRAAEFAIKKKYECISEEVLKQLGWIPLSERRDDANSAFDRPGNR